MNEILQFDDTKNKLPYNILNTLITKKQVEKLFSDNGLNFTINNLEIYQQAFVHKSYTKKREENSHNSVSSDEKLEEYEKPEDSLDLQKESNERLEFIGDAVISSVCAKYLYDRFPNQDEGFLTRIRTKIVNGESLADLAKKLGFSNYLIISKHVEERSSGRENMRILEDAFESFFGAILLDFNEKSMESYIFPEDLNLVDIKKKIKETKNKNYIKEIKNIEFKHQYECMISLIDNLESIIDHNKNLNNKFYTELFSGPGYQVAEALFINIIEKYIFWPDIILKDSNYKDQLLRYFQHTYQCTPKYQQDSIEGPPHKRMFTMSVLSFDGRILGTGRERSKKKQNN